MRATCPASVFPSVRGDTGSDEPWPAEQPPLAVFPDCTRRYWVVPLSTASYTET
jgi:hypothetical protein